MKNLTLQRALQGFVLLALYYLAGRLGIHVRLLNGVTSYVWFPSGIGLAALVLLGRGLWPWIFLAGMLVNLSARSPESAFLLGLGNAFECWIGATLMLRFVALRPTFATVRQALSFLIAVVAVSTLIGCTAESAALWLTGAIPSDRYFAIWRTWWVAEAAGELIIGGAIICWWNDLRHRLGSELRWKWDMPVLALAFLTVALFIYTPLASHNHSVIVKPYSLYTLMVWCALRFDLFGALSAALIVALVTVVGAAQGFVAASTVPVADQMVLQQLFLLSWATVGLVLASAIRERQEAIEARNEFLSIASHELKTPVTSVSLQLQLFQRELLTRKLRSPEEERWLGSFQRASHQMNRLVRIVEELLDISRIDRRDLALQRESVDLSSLITTSVDRLSPELARAHCPIELALTGGVRGQWDPFRIEQVVENLISNAIKYAPGTPIRIATSVAGDGSSVEIEVADRGPGIALDKQALIFNRFVRAEAKASGVRGLGLGLFISREIVRAHRGSIRVSSMPGEGTRFHICMPLDATSVVTV